MWWNEYSHFIVTLEFVNSYSYYRLYSHTMYAGNDSVTERRHVHYVFMYHKPHAQVDPKHARMHTAAQLSKATSTSRATHQVLIVLICGSCAEVDPVGLGSCFDLLCSASEANMRGWNSE